MTNNKTPNNLFPGHQNELGEFDYEGPASGWFSLLHHAQLAEWSYDVMERVNYIVSGKPANEQAIRLRHIVFLGELGHAYGAKLDTLDSYYCNKIAPLDAEYLDMIAPMDAEIVDYIKPLIDDFRWNGKELVFA